MDEFKDRLQELLDSCQEDTATVCRNLGINPANMKNWLKGNVYPSAESLMVLSNYFGVSVDHLLGHGEVDISLEGIRWAKYRLRRLKWFEHQGEIQERDKAEMVALSNYLALVRGRAKT